jgi:spermidine synthase
MGYAFPLSGRLVTRRATEAGQSMGLLYTWNTLGSILGSFAAAFLLAGTIGTNRSILLLAATSLLLGAALVAQDRQARSSGARLRIPVAGGLALLLLAAVLFDLPITRTLRQTQLQRAGVPTRHVEDNLATVDSVGGAPADRRLYISGVGMTALTIDTKLLAYLPKSLRPTAQDFLVIAFGMGSTYRSGLILGLHTDVVELSPSVPGQMPMFYADADTYLHHPNGHIIIADGRNYVRLSPKQYDMIAVDPAPPIQSAGTVVLYTQEFLQQGKARLTPGGVFMLWLPYDETLPDFKDHLRTFRSVFPHMDVVFGPAGTNGVYLLGSDAPLVWDDAQIARLFGSPAAQADLAGAPDFAATPGAAWPAIIARNHWLHDTDVDIFAGPGPLITDDRPRTEYYLLRTLAATDHSYINEALLRRLTGR